MSNPSIILPNERIVESFHGRFILAIIKDDICIDGKKYNVAVEKFEAFHSNPSNRVRCVFTNEKVREGGYVVYFLEHPNLFIGEEKIKIPISESVFNQLLLPGDLKYYRNAKSSKSRLPKYQIVDYEMYPLLEKLMIEFNKIKIKLQVLDGVKKVLLSINEKLTL
jgi:hypothetical protein